MSYVESRIVYTNKEIRENFVQKNKARQHGRGISGSIAVEAAFVMPIVIFTVFALIYLAFYLHDRCRIQGIMDLTLHKAGISVKHDCDITTGEVDYNNLGGRGIFYLLLGSTSDDEKQIKDLLKKDLSVGLFLTKVKTLEVNVDKSYIKVSIEADSKITLPGISYLFKTLSHFKVSGEYPIHNPAETIRRAEVILDTGSGIKGVDELKDKLEKILGTKD